MTGRDRNQLRRRRKLMRKVSKTVNLTPIAARRDALTQRVADADRRRRQDAYKDDAERDIAMLGWVSVPNRKRRQM